MTVTDLPRFVPLLKESIDLNPKISQQRINVQALTWGDSEDLKIFLEENKPLPDLILISDCIYYEASIQPLISTLENLCKVISRNLRNIYVHTYIFCKIFMFIFTKKITQFVLLFILGSSTF